MDVPYCETELIEMNEQRISENLYTGYKSDIIKNPFSGSESSIVENSYTNFDSSDNIPTEN